VIRSCQSHRGRGQRKPYDRRYRTQSRCQTSYMTSRISWQ